jgi:hypothetical protein
MFVYHHSIIQCYTEVLTVSIGTAQVQTWTLLHANSGNWSLLNAFRPITADIHISSINGKYDGINIMRLMKIS